LENWITGASVIHMLSFYQTICLWGCSGQWKHPPTR